MDVETNDLNSQVDTTEELSNAAATVSPENESYGDAYGKAFDVIDLDNPDMSLFAGETTIEENSEQPVIENEHSNEQVDTVNEVVVEDGVDNTTTNDNPFAVDEDGYLVRPLIDRGREIKVTPEELYQFGNKGTNFENKNADAKNFKEHINVLKENTNVTVDDLKSLIDLAGGNKDALKHLISKYDVDMIDVEASETEYTPEVSQYKVDEVQEVWSEFQKLNPDGAEKVSATFNTMNDDFKKEVYTPDVLPLFMKDVENGMFDTLYAETQKIKALNPNLPWLRAYSEANNRHANKRKVVTPPADVVAPIDSGRPAATGKGKANAIWDEPGAFEEMTKQLSL